MTFWIEALLSWIEARLYRSVPSILKSIGNLSLVNAGFGATSTRQNPNDIFNDFGFWYNVNTTKPKWRSQLFQDDFNKNSHWNQKTTFVSHFGFWYIVNTTKPKWRLQWVQYGFKEESLLKSRGNLSLVTLGFGTTSHFGFWYNVKTTKPKWRFQLFQYDFNKKSFWN